MTGRQIDATNDMHDPIESPETVLIVDVPDAAEPDEALRTRLTAAIEPQLPLATSLASVSLFTSDGSRWQQKIEFRFSSPAG